MLSPTSLSNSISMEVPIISTLELSLKVGRRMYSAMVRVNNQLDIGHIQIIKKELYGLIINKFKIGLERHLLESMAPY